MEVQEHSDCHQSCSVMDPEDSLKAVHYQRSYYLPVLQDFQAPLLPVSPGWNRRPETA